MAQSTKTTFDKLYQQLANWFHDFEQHEMTSAIEIIETAKQYLQAAESLSTERMTQFITNLKWDLRDFYHQYQKDAQHSVYLGLLEQEFWQNLLEITDRSQVEWAELQEDFEHHGHYQAGDYIGFGHLVCEHCQQSMTITHFSEVPECPNCGHKTFIRELLEP